MSRIWPAPAAGARPKSGAWSRLPHASLPPPPDWVVEQGIGVGRRPVAVHQGFCRPTGSRVKTISREQALTLLAEDGRLACQNCRPDTELGVL
ncbi:DUF6233 domain-containing protein [Streptomyces sp. NPDC058231]|uniref:DUF6233 domain-containing protein n=1 Tax=Streptomyces sp. NPDC058231 TaxID=3346392 RepID=UPI0036E76900